MRSPSNEKRRKSMVKPVVKITCLEDSPPSVDRELLAAYLRTKYKVVQSPYFSFRPGSPPPEVAADWLQRRGIERWAFMTAWNPRSVRLPAHENQRRNRLLARELAAGNWAFLPGAGSGPDETWLPEESYWVLTIPMAAAVSLGRQFGQNAIVGWEKDGLVELWWL